MKRYIGIKHIEAEPMTMGSAYERGLLKAGKVPKDVEKNNAGYHARYEDGYESWYSAEPFEKVYRVADTPLERILIECEYLTVKTENLRSFINSSKFDTLDISMKALLQAKVDTMTDYQYLLGMEYSKMENEGKDGVYGLPFTIALHLLKDGYTIRREKWEEECFVELNFNYFFKYEKSGDSVLWIPYKEDMFADDWELYLNT